MYYTVCPDGHYYGHYSGTVSEAIELLSETVRVL